VKKHRRVNKLDFGTTVSAPVYDCGCDVLPWEDCEHSSWDYGLTLERVTNPYCSEEQAGYNASIEAVPRSDKA
jgi:hypothetical protein